MSSVSQVVDGAGRPTRLIQFVLPVYNESEGIQAFHDELTRVAALRPDLAMEFIYVDDGSRDDSLEQLLRLRDLDDRVTVLSLSRNFGHQIAITAGLDHATDGDAVVIMDTDLQDPPAVCLDLIERWEHGGDVVYAQRRSRGDTIVKRGTAWLFYWALDRVSTTHIPRNVGDFRIMDRRVVAEVTRYREHARFMRGIVANVGFRQEAVLFDRDERFAGETGYPLRAMLKLASDGILGFSTVPLRAISRIGLLVSVLSILAALYVVGVRLLAPDQSVPGWAFLGVALCFLSGVQLIMLGVVGSYLGRIYQETQDRPLYSMGLISRAPLDSERRTAQAESFGLAQSRTGPGVTVVPRLGEALVLAGLVTRRDVNDALALQRREGGLLGEHLVRVAGLRPAAVQRALAEQWRAPLVDLAVEPPDATLLKPGHGFGSRGWLPWRRDGDGVVIAVAVAPTAQLRAFAAAVLGSPVVGVRTASEESIRAVLDALGVD